jgi:Flp pilus assembly protein TadG
MLSLLRLLRRDERGYVMVMFAIMLPVFLGIVGLLIDLSRQQTVHTSLANIADAAALAAAEALDQSDDAISNAISAGNSIQNKESYSNATVSLNYRFAASFDDLKAGNYLTGATPEENHIAAYVEVVTVTRSVSTTLAKLIGFDNMTTRSRAVAKSEHVACAVQPLMLCNPWEPQGKAFDPAAGQPQVGQQFRLTVHQGSSGGTDYTAGNFGLLDPPGSDNSGVGQGANKIRANLSSNTPNFCYVNRLTPRPGVVLNKVEEGINVRFDMPVTGQLDGTDITPAPNVIKGIKWKNAQCKQSDPVPNGALPRDSTFTRVGDLEVGNGQWDITNYWNVHHTAGASYTKTTRFKLWLDELGLNEDGTPSSTRIAFKSPPAEPYAPMCNTSVPTGGVDRRVIYVAVVDCVNAGIKGNDASDGFIKSNKIAKFFLTEPASGGVVFAEFVRLLTVENGDDKLHHIVELVETDWDPAE